MRIDFGSRSALAKARAKILRQADHLLGVAQYFQPFRRDRARGGASGRAKMMPSSLSSSRMRLETAGCDSRSLRAALRKLPSFEIHSSASSWSSRGRMIQKTYHH